MIRNKKGLVLIVLFLVAVLCICGCRPSHKLEKIRYTADSDDVDEDLEKMEIEEDGRIEDFLNNVKEQEALDQMADETEIGPEDDEGGDADSSQVIYNTAAQDEQAEDSPSEKDPNAIYRDLGVEEISSTPVPRASDNGKSKQIADASGEEVELPKNVHKATAVGVAAQIVEMVAGSGRLAGTDSETLNNEFCKLVMSDLSDVKEWWEGDGSYASISDENFNEILMDPDIDVCFEISGAETFTEEQVATLEQYNISYVALYPVDSIENLKLDVQIIGQVMTNGSGDKDDSVSRAESYISWVDSTLSETSKAAKNYSRYTVYIAGWDSSVKYKLILSDNNPFPDTKDVDADFGLSDGNGTGLAYAYTQYASEMFTELAASANVTNTSTINTVRTSGGTNTNYVYVAPVFESFRAGGGQSIDGQFSYYSGNINAGYSPFLYRLIGSTTVIPLGAGEFPAVIVSSDEVKNQIESNVFWNYSGYCGPLFSGDYKVYVNPTGMGSWVDGSIESPLEAKWVASVIDQVYTEDEVLSEVLDFYSQFFFDSNPSEETEEALKELVVEMLSDYIEIKR